MDHHQLLAQLEDSSRQKLTDKMNHQRFKIRRRGLGVDSISEIDIEKLKRCRSPSLGASNEDLRQNLLKLDDENVRQHLGKDLLISEKKFF